MLFNSFPDVHESSKTDRRQPPYITYESKKDNIVPGRTGSAKQYKQRRPNRNMCQKNAETYDARYYSGRTFRA